jgi:hypothetical protein
MIKAEGENESSALASKAKARSVEFLVVGRNEVMS